jgi:hypothetical protein
MDESTEVMIGDVVALVDGEFRPKNYRKQNCNNTFPPRNQSRLDCMYRLANPGTKKMLAQQVVLQSVLELTEERLAPLAAIRPQIAFVFAAPDYFRDPAFAQRFAELLPGCKAVGCSTAGEISMRSTYEDSISVTALHFDSPAFEIVTADLEHGDDSKAVGTRIGAQLQEKGCHTILLFAPGTQINGSQLVEGVIAAAPTAKIAGGLAGDGVKFAETFTLSGTVVSRRQVVAVGFNGDNLSVGFGSYGGWKPFGPIRRVTRAQQNVLFELDGEPALSIYKKYLGAYAADLPASGLRFPFSILNANREEVGMIRTILGVSEEDGSLILAGDVHDNGYLQLMQASTDALVEGAAIAAAAAAVDDIAGQAFGLVISCIGRKLVMGGRCEEELDSVVDALGPAHVFSGFHSYGEINPGEASVGCSLYNQTMTVTFLGER